jgi:uncharacterized membrane protein
MDCSTTLAFLILLAVVVTLEIRRAGELRRLREELQGETFALRARLEILERAPSPAEEIVQEEAPPLRAEPAAPAPPPPPPVPPVAAAPETEEAPRPTPPPAPKGPSWEEQLGARLPVWIGSIALALAGAFLVKYSFERGWLSPTVRVALGVAFGVALLGAGELMRRSASRISQGLSGAGIAVLFAGFLAGIHLYGLISPGVGFALMALTTATAVALSLRQGPMVALIGLIGGFLTPYLVHTGEPSVRGLFAYLLLLEIGLFTVARRRRWLPIAGLALGGGLLWVVLWLLGPFQAADAGWLGGFLVLTALAAVVAGLATTREPDEAGSLREPGFSALALAGLPGSLVVMAAVVGRAGWSTAEWSFFGLLAAGTLVLARLRPRLELLAWVAAAVGAALLLVWGWDLQEPDAHRFLGTTAALGALFAGGAYAALHGSPRPGRWASLSTASGVGFFLIAWAATNRELELEPRWGAAALALAALYLAAAVPLARRRRRRAETEPDPTPALAAMAVAVTAFVSLAAPLELERQWITVSWALEVTALVALAGRFRLPALRILAALLAVAVGLRLLLNPEVLDYPIGEHPVFHWLLYGYGVPLAAFVAAAVLARRQDDARLALLFEAEALAFAFALVSLEVRQLYHPGRPGEADLGFAEWGSLIAAWAALGLGLLAWNRGRRLASVEWGGRILLALAAAAAWVGPMLVANPLWAHEPVGETPVVNLLLWTFGLPAALLALGAAELGSRGPRVLRSALISTSLALAFVLISLEVRQAFHGSYLTEGATTAAERYAYSAAWILFGAALPGRRSGRPGPRQGAALRLPGGDARGGRQGLPLRHGEPDRPLPGVLLPRPRRELAAARLGVPAVRVPRE